MLAVERILRGIFIVLAAVAVWRFSNSQDAVRDLFEKDLTFLRPVAVHFHYDLDHSPVVDSIRKTFTYKHSTLVEVALVLLAYALVELVEGVGLWMARRWAEYLTVVATAAFLPLEVLRTGREGQLAQERHPHAERARGALHPAGQAAVRAARRCRGLRGGAPW